MLRNVLIAVITLLYATHITKGSTYEDFEPVWKRLLAKQNNSRLGYSKDLNQYGADRVQGYGNPYLTPGNIQYLINGPSYTTTTAYPQTFSLISTGIGIIDSDVKCGTDNRNFCNYPELPFIETLNIPQLLANPNRLNRISSGKCPDGYKKYPTKDCINIAPAVIETTCCVYETPALNLTDYCSNRQGIQFTATFELCDGRDFIIAGSSAWQIDDSFKILGGPYSLNTLTGGAVSSSVDSALVDSSCNVGFFQGKNLHWMNFPNRTASTDHTLSELLGPIPANLCGGNNCSATAINFAVCPNNGFCLTSVNLTTASGTVYKQLFLLAPGFNSFISSALTPPGIAVLNNQGLNTTYQNYITATYLRTTNRLAFTDASNNVYFYDPTGKLLSGPTNLFDLFGTCGTTASTITGSQSYTLYIPYPIYGASFNQTNPYLPQQLPVFSHLPASYDPSALSGLNYVQNQNPPSSYVATAPSPPAPHTYYDIPKPEPYRQYPTPAPQYATPAPTYQPAPAPTPAPSYQPSPSPQPAPYQPYQQGPKPGVWPSYPTLNMAQPSYQQISSGNQYPIIIPGSQYGQPSQYQTSTPAVQYNMPTPAPTYSPQPQYKPDTAPVQYQPAPSPQYYQPTPAPQYQPTPAPYQSPQPAYNSPAPSSQYQPAAPSDYNAPAPSPPYQPSPPVYNQPAPALQYQPSPPAYNQPTPTPQYQPSPPAYDQPAPAPQYQPTPAPQYPPAPQPAYSQPGPSPYQSPSPSYQPAPAPQYQPTTTPVYKTTSPSYDDDKYFNPSPPSKYNNPSPAPYPAPSPQSGYSAPYQRPYLVQPLDLPMYVPSVPSYGYQEPEVTRKPYKVIAMTPATTKKWKETAPSSHQFFDLSSFVRKAGSFEDEDEADSDRPNGNRMVLI